MAVSPKGDFVAAIIEDYETNCWGCGLRLLLPAFSPVFKCGWCGAITNHNKTKPEKEGFWWRHFRDRLSVCVLCVFVLFLICGGVWAVYPIVFSVSYKLGIFHSTITFFLSISTLSAFVMASFKCPGRPPNIVWGSFPAVGKGDLEGYTFCHYCSKPKSPRAHHCRTCGICILDMDHHCPFIGNCVGAANHRHFIAFLISAVVSMSYASLMFAYAGMRILPPVVHRSINLHTYSILSALKVMKEVFVAFLSSAMFMSPRALVLIYLFVASISVEIGLSVLLWQQLSYIYEGKTYLSHLSLQGGEEGAEKSCLNLVQFFGCPYSISRYLPVVRNSQKRHKK